MTSLTSYPSLGRVECIVGGNWRSGQPEASPAGTGKGSAKGLKKLNFDKIMNHKVNSHSTLS